MKYIFLTTLAACIISLSIHSPFKHNADPLLKELEYLAKSKEMELVIGDKFPVINPYGSYGSPYVVDFIFNPSESNNLERSVLFLCRKKDKGYTKKIKESSLDLVNYYNYFLLFATKDKHTRDYKVQDIIPNAGLMGMSLYYGYLDMDLSQFKYISNEAISGPKGVQVNFINGCVPIIISSESSTQILYYYQDKWLSYLEIDE